MKHKASGDSDRRGSQLGRSAVAAVLDVAGIGIPHKEMGEEFRCLAMAAVDDPPSGEEMIAWCRERLSHYKCPRSFEWVDTLGRNTMGKINKRKLRAPFWE